MKTKERERKTKMEINYENTQHSVFTDITDMQGRPSPKTKSHDATSTPPFLPPLPLPPFFLFLPFLLPSPSLRSHSFLPLEVEPLKSS